MFKVVLADSARQVYEAAEANLQRKLDRCFSRLAQEPRRHPNIKPLKGRLKGYWRYRVGDHRVVYRIEGSQLVIVTMIRGRKEAYS